MRRYLAGDNFRIASQLDNIVVLRPIVATQDIGFLPGTAEEKVEPYLKQVFVYLNEIPEEYRSKKFTNMISTAKALIKDKESIPTDLVSLARSAGLIRVELVELARGANFRNAFIMGDELENVTVPVFETLLDRAEDGCKIAFSGDVRQCDLKPGMTSGLALYADMYRHAKPEELWCAAVVDLKHPIRSVRIQANHQMLAKYLETNPDLNKQFKQSVYSHGVMPTINKTR
jgi:PhoH-like ATPase